MEFSLLSLIQNYLVNGFGIFLLIVLGNFQAENGLSFREKPTSLDGVFDIKRGSPVIKDAGSIYQDKPFYIIK